MIPAEAVEAAERVFDERFEIGQAFGPDSIRAMLEAAAPHMLNHERNRVQEELAVAWEIGRQAGHYHMIGKRTPNPYRATTERGGE